VQVLDKLAMPELSTLAIVPKGRYETNLATRSSEEPTRRLRLGPNHSPKYGLAA